MIILSVKWFTHFSRFASKIRVLEPRGEHGTDSTFAFVLRGTDMREYVFLFCLLGLVLIATILLLTEPAAVTWALALI
jgi:hypothetical protein